MSRPYRSILLSVRSLVFLVLCLSVAGCGRISFVSDRYDNFTAYYNTFYNAERSYEQGVEVLEQSTEPIDRQQYISVFPSPNRTGNDQAFQATIDKSADVLRDHPNSKWVDDALVLIGKSYYYQQNYVSAEQKFREAIDLGSALEDEARLWLARTLIASGSYDSAREHLLESLNLEDLSDRWEPSLRLAMGELYVKRGAFQDAVDELSMGLENVRDRSLEARGWFLLGQVYEALGRYSDAVDAFERVSNAHPRYELTYAAQLSAVRIEGLHLDGESALREVRRMERDDKNYTNRYELAYLRGRIYQSIGYPDDARTIYHDILYDSDGQIADVRGKIHYSLGELYRDAYVDFQMASAHFDTATTTLQAPTSERSSGLETDFTHTSEAITDAAAQAEMFGSFADVSSRIAEMDSLLYLGELNEDDFAAKIFEIRTKMAEEFAEEERRAERLQAQQGFQNNDAGGANRQTSGQNDPTGSSGFLYHADPVRVQEGRMNFVLRWGDRPHAPNWRRQAAVENVSSDEGLAAALPEQRLEDLDPSVGENPLPPLDYSDVPRDSISRAELQARRAAARYELANVLFLSMDQPDSAATWYRAVIEEDSEFPVAQRAFYALAEVHRSLGDSTSAKRLYEQVLRDYPTSDFAGRVRERLGIRDDVPSDTLTLAEEDYEFAFQRWQRGSYSSALNRMVEVAAEYRGMEVAPRALLAAGRIYLEWADRDSLDVYGPLPLSVPDSILGEAGLLNIAEASPDSAEFDPGIANDVGRTTEAETADSAHVDGSQVTEEGAPTGGTQPKGDVPATRAGEQEAGRTFTPRIALENQAADTFRSAESGAGEADTTSNDPVSSSTNPEPSVEADEPPSDLEQPVLAEPADSMNVALTPAAADTATGNPATDNLASDTTLADPRLLAAAEVGDEVYLNTLYAGVKHHYPSTAYADLADRLLTALEERHLALQAAADSAAAAAAAPVTDSSGSAPDSLAEDYAGLTDSLSTGEYVQTPDSVTSAYTNSTPDSTSQPESRLGGSGSSTVESRRAAESAASNADSSVVAKFDPRIGSSGDSTEALHSPSASAEAVDPDVSQNESSIRGEGGIRRELGGYTLLLGKHAVEETMKALADKYAKEGFRTGVMVEKTDDHTVFCAVLGQFTTRREAGMLMQKYASHFEAQIRPVALDEFE